MATTNYLKALLPGKCYGNGIMSGAGEAGLCVVLSDDNVFAINDDPTVRSFGILAEDVDDGDYCAVYCDGGIYETDQYNGVITEGTFLQASDTADHLGELEPLGEGGVTIGQAISVVSGVLRFKLFV